MFPRSKTSSKTFSGDTHPTTRKSPYHLIQPDPHPNRTTAAHGPMIARARTISPLQKIYLVLQLASPVPTARRVRTRHTQSPTRQLRVASPSLLGASLMFLVS